MGWRDLVRAALTALIDTALRRPPVPPQVVPFPPQPAPAAPEVPAPPPPVIVGPERKETEDELRKRVRLIYKEALGRYPSDEQEYVEAIVLLEQSRENELWRNLIARK